MSFKLLTVLQLIQILSLYLLVTVCLPAWVFHKKFSGFSLSVRLMFYYVIGNFFVINLVFLLQLLHISNYVTLLLGTVGAAGFFGIKNNALKPAAALRKLWRDVELVLRGGMGYRTLFLKMWKGIRKNVGRAFFALRKFARGRILDLFLAVGVTALFFARFAGNLLSTYGYSASDMIVHNYWVNALGEGKLFVAGVYPYGFHCLIYYMHELSGIDNYILLRIFWIVQTLMVFYSVLVFLKGCCKNRYLPYLGVAVYVLGTLGVFSDGTYVFFSRFLQLPQNFGVVFILPSVLFLFLFFEEKKAELDRGEDAGKKSLWCLAGFAMSLALAISIHFYCAMIIGLFCIGGIVGYGFRLFRKQYFLRVIAAGMIAVVIAAFPMVLAGLTGTRLEGSLHWGMNIIQNSLDSEETEEGTAGESKEQGTSNRSKPLVNDAVEQELKAYIIRQEYHGCVKYIMVALIALPLAGVLFLILGHRDYGARLVTTGFCLWLLGILMAAGKLGLPALMDEMRSSLYFALALIVGIAFLLDALLFGLTFWIRRETVRNIVSLSPLVLVVVAALGSGIMNDIPIVGGFGMNEAVVCLTNIIRENQDRTWTILSANDELRMADDHGYHYELTDFLRAMERQEDPASVTIPTKYVYIFIEKTPQNYSETSYYGSGQSVSEEGAARALPEGSGLGPYQLENRWIIMSRMYYWAKAFQKLYPNELKVYYETDDFVCYCLEQNTYSLYNLAIDYGYNMR